MSNFNEHSLEMAIMELFEQQGYSYVNGETITQRFDNTATKFNKSAFNTAIQSALINKEVITLSKETIDKFDKLLAELNKYKF